MLSESHLISVWVIEIHPKGDDETEERRADQKEMVKTLLFGGIWMQGGQSNLDRHQGTDAKSQDQGKITEPG